MTSISTSNSWSTYKSRRRRPTLLGGCTRCFRWSVMCTSTGRQWGWCTASGKADNRELSLAFSAAQTSNWHRTEACIWLPRIWCHPWANILSLETGKQKNFSSLPFPSLPFLPTCVDGFAEQQQQQQQQQHRSLFLSSAAILQQGFVFRNPKP